MTLTSLWARTGEFTRDKNGCLKEVCACVCGKRAAVYIKRGQPASRGCASCSAIERGARPPSRLAHGEAVGGKLSTTYISWMQMKARCTNPDNPAYANYGGRGIRVCEEWMSSFEAFLRDMGPRPPRLTLERKDNDGHYEPGNCRWATYTEQARNRRSSTAYALNGETLTLTEWAERHGLLPETVKKRLMRGWSLEESLRSPLVTFREAGRRAGTASGKSRRHRAA